MKIRKYKFGGNPTPWLPISSPLNQYNYLPSVNYNNIGLAQLVQGVPIVANYSTSPDIPKTLDTSGLNNKINNLLLLKLTSTGNQVLSSGAQLVGLTGIDYLSNKLFDLSTDWGRGLGTLFSQGSSTAMGRLSSNIMKGLYLTEGLGQDVGASLAGAAAGLAGNYIGRGITSLGGNSMLSRGIGAGTGTAIGSVGGTVLSNAVKGKTLLTGLTSGANIGGIAGSVVGAGLQAAFGPSKEYSGTYGGITKTADTVYDVVLTAAGFIPVYGQLISGAMALNKGLSNVFGSTSGMTLQDAILGSAFMGAPVKWLNMAGARTTGNFNNLSWLNVEKANSFMGNAFGNLGDRFDLARKESNKTYGTFSRSAYRAAQNNIDFANYAWDKVLAMADLNELLNIRSLYMSSINNLRYAQDIQGAWQPVYRGKQGMKIFNNATNHNIGMRLLSGAALIDSKQMILSAQGGTKFGKRRFTKEELEANRLKVYLLEREAAERRSKANTKGAEKFNKTANTVMGAMTLQTNETPFTGQEYLQAAENLRLEKVEKLHEAEKVGEAAMMADLAVSAAPLLLRGFRWAFNKTGLLVKVSKYPELSAPEIPIEVSNYTGKWKNWVEEIQPKLTNKTYDSKKLISIGNASKDKAFLYYKSDEFIKRAKNAGFNDSEISLLQKELLDMLNHSLVKSSSSSNNGVHAWADAYLDNSGNLYRNATSFEPHVQGFSLEDIIGMWDHEFGHVATNMYNSVGKNLGNFMQQVESRYPMIVKMMKYNESIAPKLKSELENLYNFWHSPNVEMKLKQSYPELSESEINEFINKYLKFSENIKEYIGNSNELRSRALSTLFAALRKGKSAYLYILENSEDLNAARELNNIFENKSLKKYLDNFLNYSVPITTVGGTSYVSTK